MSEWMCVCRLNSMFPLMLINFVLLRSTDGNESWVEALTKREHRLQGEVCTKGEAKEKRWPECQRLLQGWSDVSLSARQVKMKQSCMPQVIFVLDDSKLMSYLGQSTWRMKCLLREKKRGGGGGDIPQHKYIKIHVWMYEAMADATDIW